MSSGIRSELQRRAFKEGRLVVPISKEGYEKGLERETVGEGESEYSLPRSSPSPSGDDGSLVYPWV